MNKPQQPAINASEQEWDAYYQACFKARLADIKPEPWLVLEGLTDTEKIALLQTMVKCFYFNWQCGYGDNANRWHHDTGISYVLDFARYEFDIHAFEDADFCSTLKEPK